MTQQVAVVTGASSGIGEALAAAMAKRGTHVVLVARSRDRLEGLATRVRQAGGQATVVVADLSQPGAAQRLFDDVERLKLPVDTLVNNAGFGHFGRFEKCLAAMDGSRPSTVVGLVNFLLAHSGRFAPRSVSARISAMLLSPKEPAVAALSAGGRS